MKRRLDEIESHLAEQRQQIEALVALLSIELRPTQDQHR
jgi:hypothetical protein